MYLDRMNSVRLLRSGSYVAKMNCVAILTHLSGRLICELIVYGAIRRPSVVRRQNFQMTSPLKPCSRFFSYYTYSIYRWGERIIVFCSCRIRTLVTMTTYSSHRFIMGKVESGNFCCLIDNGDN